MFLVGLVGMIVTGIIVVVLGLWCKPKELRLKLLVVAGLLFALSFSTAYLSGGGGSWTKLGVLALMVGAGILCVRSMYGPMDSYNNKRRR